jgi:hypothetical protein
MNPIILISAPWCKRCNELKPSIASLCAIVGRELSVVNFDDLDDDDPMKTNVKSLPTLLMDGKTYTTATFEDWKTAALASVPLKGSDDF